ncbi:MAG: hypothetical protein E7257_03490 [Lachnospiraceae bacterium]|nr:hypothetical protein [Lachnospiraceae bacterium]
MNKKKIIYIIILCVLLAVFTISRIFAYREKVTEETKTLNYRFQTCLFLQVVHSDVSYNKVEQKYVPSEQGQPLLRIMISYYNCYNEDKVDYDMLIREYHNFCDGKKTYENLERYADFIYDKCYIPLEEMSPDNLDCKYSAGHCGTLLRNAYGIDSKFSEEYSNLTQEQVDAICVPLYQQKENLFNRVICSQLLSASSLPYYMYQSGFDDSQLETNEDGETVIWSDDSSVCCYLSKGELGYLPGEEQWYVSKIEFVKPSNYGIMGLRVGMAKKKALTKCSSTMIGEYLLEREDFEDKVVMRRGQIVLTVEFENDVCSKFVLEVEG